MEDDMLDQATARALPALLLLALVLAAPVAAAREFEELVYLHELPQGGLHVVPELIHASPGDTLTLTVENQGQSPHDLHFCADAGQSATNPPSDCRQRGGFTPMLGAGEKAPLTLTTTAPGTYWYYCDIPGHKQAGMAGRLVVSGDEVEEKDAPAPSAFGALLALGLAAAFLGRRRG